MSADGLTAWLPEPPRRSVGEHGLDTYVSVPTGAAPPSGWPALIFLHGNGECADRRTMPEAFLDTGTAHGPFRRVTPALEQRIRQRFVIAAPQLAGMGGDVWQDHGADVVALVDELIDGESVDPDRITLSGFSYGANGVVRLSRVRPWHALWLVDPPMSPPDSLPDVRRYRMAFGQYTVDHEAGWLEVMPDDRRATIDYGPVHAQASWLDFEDPENYDGLA